MRIVRFQDAQGKVCLGRDNGETGVAELLGGDLFGKLSPTGKSVKIGKLLAPVAPAGIFCIGLNYAAHAREGGNPIPERPVVFMKPLTTLTHPGDPIRIPRCQLAGPEVDYEAELAVVIGKTGKDIAEADALKHVLGYTCGHDVSARRWQTQGGGGQWVRGKGFDTFCPLGPVLVTADEIPDPQVLGIKSTLNGQVMQSSNTSDMIFTVAKLVSFLSQDTTLAAGTVILTGTPQGVGAARKPPVFLKAGDEVVIEVEKIGRLVNPVVEG